MTAAILAAWALKGGFVNETDAERDVLTYVFEWTFVLFCRRMMLMLP